MERELKLWGERWILRKSSNNALSYLVVKEGHRCSWHHHEQKFNLFFVLSGKLEILTEDGSVILGPGETYTVSPGVWHEFRAHENSTCIEDMFVEYHEGDIIRKNQGGRFKI